MLQQIIWRLAFFLAMLRSTGDLNYTLHCALAAEYHPDVSPTEAADDDLSYAMQDS